jgi:DNA topoisomerase VI subunit A
MLTGSSLVTAAGKVLSYRIPTKIILFPRSEKRTFIAMEYTYEQLKHKTVAELRDIAKGNEHEALQGYTQLNKEHLLVALSKALGIKHEHHDVVGVDKGSIKARIRDMKKKRDEALSAHDHAQLKVARRTIHRLKRQIHKATV